MKTTVVGAGINGVVAAIELRKRGHDVVLVDPGPLPHPLAASTDISKVVRAAYGADEEYTELADRYPDGFLGFEAGYAESGRAVAVLIEGARSIGVELREHAKFCALDETSDRVKGIVLESGEKVPADAVVMAVGAWTPYVLPFTHDFFRASGQPVFHLKPAQPELFAPECFPIFGADICA